MLLPIRLETRFADAADGTTELLVRIYPDQVHVDAHDPRLTPGEVAAGQGFWVADWRSGSDAERRGRAWRALAERLDPGRAAWVARATLPENAAARPDQAVADGDPPLVEPVFGAPPMAERAATPVARLLPGAWTATAYAGGQIAAIATGRPISLDPAVGPDIDAPLVDPASEGDENSEVAALDQGMNWLVDFAAAEAIGMALRLPVSGPVDVLLVAGVRAGGPDAGAEGLAALLDAQRYTAGLGFVAPGTPTNNASDVPSGWSSAALGKLGASDGAAAAEPGSIAASAARAIGVGDTHLTGLPGGDRNDGQQLAAAVARALWPATWGYWLTQFVGIGTAGLSVEDCDWVRDHAGRFVRPGGSLPVIRVGRQPYGVLPVTALTRFRGDPRETRLGAIVSGLIVAGWRPALGKVARLGRDDPANDLVEVLRGDAVSSGVTMRRAFGPTFAASTLDFLERTVPPEEWLAFAQRARALTEAMGVPAGIAAALTLHDPTEWPVGLPLVGNDHATMLADLLAADIDTLAADADGRPTSLLAALIRQGWLREHAAAAARLIGDPAVASTRDEEFFGFDAGPLGWTAQRERLVDGSTVRERLASGTDAAGAGIEAFRLAVGTVAAASADQLGPQLAGALDAASHRIDAWATSLATRRLAELRAVAPAGVVVGGYGWVEGLRRDPPELVTGTVAGEPGALRRASDDPGFLHAPSIHQAQVAALLRNVHLVHGGGDDDPFAITITSQRVRLAQRIFDGVRAGRGLGAVLGYLVERDLHERGLDAAVDNAREVTPLPGQETLPIPARRLDGLALHQLWADSEDHALDHLVPGGDPNLPQPTFEEQRRKAAGVLRRLGVAVDAAADLLQAEQVHQFARGNLTAAVNTLGDIDRGLTPPPDLDFIRTPRSGVTVTHRVAILLAVDAVPTEGWAEAAASPRAETEPALDAWLARCLGPASGRNLALVDGNGTEHPVPLPDLRLSASDFVRLAGGGDAGLAELTARAARAFPAAVPSERSQLLPNRDLLDLLELGRSLSLLAAAGRPLDGSRLQPPHADPQAGIDLDELLARTSRADQRVRSALASLDAALAGADTGAVDAALAASWDFALGDTAIPAVRDEASLRAAAARAREALEGRLGEAGAAPAPADEPDKLIQRAQGLLGPGSVVLPRFLLPDAADLIASRDDPALAGADPLVAETWLTRLERVREPLMRLGVAMREAEAMGGTPPGLSLAQVPHRPGAAWNGRPAPAYVDGAASLVLLGGELLAPARQLGGLLVDEFTEFVPSSTESTGVTFRYEPPAAMAPQALLLAVPPVIGEPWTVGGLNQVLLETLELARVRALDPDDLDLVRQFLPATVLPFNTEGDVPSTNPNALSGG
ncbi:hypothetical protein IAG41_06990 [Sphingomonas sp. JC676]|uniref:hypothetical protein n=1 Tax=Sphingomonas sp. JC676 TaxID=2768065 RepID=UPI001657CD85|nr:hypothetical protein [Sphingomonas sp. JC676]MBC9032131.1 hypothetical protein [Sphingomonas sp. JC676]